MKKRLSIDNPFFEFMERLADIVILNLLFLLCSIPVFTIGASVSAMYQTTREMRGESFVSSLRSFLSAWKYSFKRSFLAWMLQCVTGVILVFDLLFVAKAGNIWFWHVAGIVLGSMLLIWMMICCYLLPAGIYENRSVREALLRSFYLAVRNLPYTLLMMFLNSIPAICVLSGELFMSLATPIYVIAGFGATAYLNCILLKKCKEVDETGDCYERKRNL